MPILMKILKMYFKVKYYEVNKKSNLHIVIGTYKVTKNKSNSPFCVSHAKKNFWLILQSKTLILLEIVWLIWRHVALSQIFKWIIWQTGYNRVGSLCVECSNFPWSALSFGVYLLLLVGTVMCRGFTDPVCTKVCLVCL
jgi:uncharacterized integral membrane protein